MSTNLAAQCVCIVHQRWCICLGPFLCLLLYLPSHTPPPPLPTRNLVLYPRRLGGTQAGHGAGCRVLTYPIYPGLASSFHAYSLLQASGSARLPGAGFCLMSVLPYPGGGVGGWVWQNFRVGGCPTTPPPPG